MMSDKAGGEREIQDEERELTARLAAEANNSDHDDPGIDQTDRGEASVHAPVPEALNRNLRCCIPCRLVKTLEQFYQQGCENCTFLDLEGDRERIEDCTTTEFQGMLGVVDPEGSWATRYTFMQRKRVPGVYALSVDHANLQPHIRELLEDNGVKLQ